MDMIKIIVEVCSQYRRDKYYFSDIPDAIKTVAAQKCNIIDPDDIVAILDCSTGSVSWLKEFVVITKDSLVWNNVGGKISSFLFSEIFNIHLEISKGLFSDQIEFDKESKLTMDKDLIQFCFLLIREIQAACQKALSIPDCWHVCVRGKVLGFFDKVKIEHLFVSGKFAPSETFVYREGMRRWQAAVSLEEFDAIVPSSCKLPPLPDTATSEAEDMQSDMDLDNAAWHVAAALGKGQLLDNSRMIYDFSRCVLAGNPTSDKA